MTSELIEKINQLLKTSLHPAPARETDPLGALMAYKEATPKYLLEAGHLVGLNLANTGLTDDKWMDIAALDGFHPEHIRALNLSDNKLSAFPIPDSMKALERLDLSDNQIKEFSLPMGLDRLSEMNLEGNPLTSIPEETLKQGRQAVLRYLKNIAAQGVREVFEVKMLIVGEGGTGKTTLWNKLQNPDHPVPDEKQLSTVGIGIKEGWEFPHLDHPEKPFLVNLWDFGGQEIQYMTHQFFLTRRSFYVLLADGRKEIANFPYWFKIIDLLGTDPQQESPLPVLVILNERGNPIAKMPYDPGKTKEDFPRLEVKKREVDFAKKDDRLKGLPIAIQEILCRQLPHLPLRIPAYWDAVRRELDDLGKEKNHIDFKEFKAICVKSGIASDDEKQMTDLSQLFHDLGVLLHYHEDISLRDFIVLNPEWAVNAVYEVLRHEEVKENQGRFDKKMLQRVWDKCHYDTYEQKNLLDLMRKDNFEVCFKTEENGREIYIAPQMLPELRPDSLDWSPHGPFLKYSFQYPFMPKGIIGRLIVRLHEHLQTREGKKMVWEKGMVLAKDGCKALVQETEGVSTGLKLIQIEVTGGKTAEDRRFVLRDIRQELDRIHRSSFPSLKFEEKIPCCCNLCSSSTDPHFFDLSTLKEREQMPKKTIECPKSSHDVAVKDLLGGVFPAAEIIEDEKTNTMNPIQELITKCKLNEALSKLLDYVPVGQKSDVIQLQGQLAHLERNERIGTVDHAEAGKERAKITKAALDLCSEPAPSPSGTPAKTIKPGARIYFSYAWGDDQEEGESRGKIVNDLYQSLVDDQFNVFRDNMNIDYGGLISEFMKELGQGDLVVVFVSDKYVKSPYCMFELYEIARNSRWEKQLFSSRILPVAVDRIRFDSPKVLETYFDYWENAEKEWASFIQKRLDQASEAQSKRYHNTKEINQNFGKLSDWLTDMNAKTKAILKENDFEEVKKAILARLDKLTNQ